MEDVHGGVAHYARVHNGLTKERERSGLSQQQQQSAAAVATATTQRGGRGHACELLGFHPRLSPPAPSRFLPVSHFISSASALSVYAPLAGSFLTFTCVMRLCVWRAAMSCSRSRRGLYAR